MPLQKRNNITTTVTFAIIVRRLIAFQFFFSFQVNKWMIVSNLWYIYVMCVYIKSDYCQKVANSTAQTQNLVEFFFLLVHFNIYNCLWNRNILYWHSIEINYYSSWILLLSINYTKRYNFIHIIIVCNVWFLFCIRTGIFFFNFNQRHNLAG